MSERGGNNAPDSEPFSLEDQTNRLVGIALNNLAGANDATIKNGIVATALTLIEGDLIESFRDMERLLRTQPEESSLFLIGVPKSFYTDAGIENIIYPWDSEDTPQYAVCICTSIEEANSIYEMYNLTYEENLRRLYFAGVPGGTHSELICFSR